MIGQSVIIVIYLIYKIQDIPITKSILWNNLRVMNHLLRNQQLIGFDYKIVEQSIHVQVIKLIQKLIIQNMFHQQQFVYLFNK